MTKALLRVRFRALFHSMLRQSRQKRRHGTGMTVLFILLFAYVGVVFCGMFALMFSKLAPAYHTAGLDWLYFATAGSWPWACRYLAASLPPKVKFTMPKTTVCSCPCPSHPGPFS